MIEKDPVGGVQPEGLPVIHHDPVSVELGCGVGGAGIKRSIFVLRGLLGFSKELRGGSLVEAGLILEPDLLDSIQKSQGSDCVDLGGVFRHIKGHLHMALGGEVINLIRADLLHQPVEIRRVRHVSMVEKQANPVDVLVGEEMINPPGCE